MINSFGLQALSLVLATQAAGNPFPKKVGQDDFAQDYAVKVCFTNVDSERCRTSSTCSSLLQLVDPIFFHLV